MSTAIASPNHASRFRRSVLSPVLGCGVVQWEVGKVIHWIEPDRDTAICGFNPRWHDSFDLGPGLIDCGLCNARAFGGGDWRDLHGFPGDDS